MAGKGYILTLSNVFIMIEACGKKGLHNDSVTYIYYDRRLWQERAIHIDIVMYIYYDRRLQQERATY